MLRPWYRYAIHVSEKTHIVPSALTLGKKCVKELTAGPIYIGGSATIYQGQLDGRTVAVKQFRVCRETQSTTVRHFIREALIMDIVRHPLILPLTSTTCQHGCPSILTPWQTNGSVVEFLLNTPDANRERIVAGVAEGLEFLKSSGVIHGDLKGQNIVIDDGGAPRIADFGLSFLDWESSSSIETRSHIMVGTFASGDISAVLAAEAVPSAYTRSGAGSPRWMAPELLVPEVYNKTTALPTFESDMFSFGMLIYEIYSGLVPFQDHTNITAVLQILEGRRPPRPIQIPDWMWCITKKCWADNSRLRPSIGNIRAQLQPENVLIVDHLGRFIRIWNNWSKTQEPLETKKN